MTAIRPLWGSLNQLQKIQRVLPVTVVHNSTRFHKNSLKTLRVILFRDKHANITTVVITLHPRRRYQVHVTVMMAALPDVFTVTTGDE